ncbi:MAG: ABC transporter permease [Candidatus Promineifilaceae bacterium]
MATSDSLAASPVTLDDDVALSEQRRLERLLGPEWARLIRGVFTNPLSVAGMIIISLLALMALFAPVLAPPLSSDPYGIPRDGFSSEPKPPGTPWTDPDLPDEVSAWRRVITGKDEWTHLLGTSSGQYDIWYGIVWGARTAFIVGSIVVFASATVGILVGALAGFYGRWVDWLLMRIVEIFQAFPFLVAAFVLAAILVPKLGRSLLPAVIALVVFGWTGYARLLRGDILSTKERDYVLAARASGAKDARIILKHILPNAIFPTIVLLSLDMGAIVLSFAALSFLGVGTEVGYADWGQIVAFARDWIFSLDQYWYIIVFPGVALLLYGLGWNLIGDALRDIMDPKLRGRGN